MIRAGVGQSVNSSAEKAAEEAAAQALTALGTRSADSALVFFSHHHAQNYAKLAPVLERLSGCPNIVGCSSAGVLTAAGEIENQPGLAVLFLSSDQMRSDAFLYEPLRGREEALASEISQLSRNNSPQRLLTLFPDTYNAQPQVLLKGIQAPAGFFPVVGAGASGGAEAASYQSYGTRVTSNAVAGLHLYGSFGALIDITQGCQPLTPPMIVTRAKKNLIFEIDNRPAFEVFAGLLRGPLAEDLRRALMFVFVGLPANRDQTIIEPGEYVVRNIIGLDRSQGIVAVAEVVREGEPIMLVLRDGERARDDLAQMLQRQAHRLKGMAPAFGFYFNCCARGTSLYALPDIDTAYIRSALGDFPLIGMFGGYELAPLHNANHLFAYTGVLALITE